MQRKIVLVSTILGFSIFLLLIAPTSAESTTWANTYGGTGIDVVYSMIKTLDGGFALAGVSNNDFWLLKVSASGNMEWSRTYGGPSSEVAYSLIQTSDRGYALAGETCSFGAGGVSGPIPCSDYWLVKTDATGIMEWNKTYGGTLNDYANALIQTKDGGYALAGAYNSSDVSFGHIFESNYVFDESLFWLIKTDISGNMEWNQTYRNRPYLNIAYSLVGTSDGGYALVGSTANAYKPSYSYDAVCWFLKTDSLGGVIWSQTYDKAKSIPGSPFTSTVARSLIITSDGGYALAGNSYSGIDSDFWLLKTNAEGNQVWNQRYAEVGLDKAYALAETPEGGYAFAGAKDLADEIISSIWVHHSVFCLVKTDASGSIEWKQTYAADGVNIPYAMVVTSDGGYALAGRRDMNYNYTRQMQELNVDAWLIKTDKSGVAPVAAFVVPPPTPTLSPTPYVPQPSPKQSSNPSNPPSTNTPTSYPSISPTPTVPEIQTITTVVILSIGTAIGLYMRVKKN